MSATRSVTTSTAPSGPASSWARAGRGEHLLAGADRIGVCGVDDEVDGGAAALGRLFAVAGRDHDTGDDLLAAQRRVEAFPVGDGHDPQRPLALQALHECRLGLRGEYPHRQVRVTREYRPERGDDDDRHDEDEGGAHTVGEVADDAGPGDHQHLHDTNRRADRT